MDVLDDCVGFEEAAVVGLSKIKHGAVIPGANYYGVFGIQPSGEAGDEVGLAHDSGKSFSSGMIPLAMRMLQRLKPAWVRIGHSRLPVFSYCQAKNSANINSGTKLSRLTWTAAKSSAGTRYASERYDER